MSREPCLTHGNRIRNATKCVGDTAMCNDCFAEEQTNVEVEEIGRLTAVRAANPAKVLVVDSSSASGPVESGIRHLFKAASNSLRVRLRSS
jgi:hypothetical protein